MTPEAVVSEGGIVMKWAGTKRVQLSELRFPSDEGPGRAGWPSAREGLHALDDERADQIGASAIHTGGPVNLPVVELSTMEIVSGKHRVRGEQRRGEADIEVRLWSGSPEEKRILRAADNAFPRADGSRWIAELVAAREALIVTQRRGHSAHGVASKKTPRGEAREQVARELGRTEEAVRRAERRGQEREVPPGPPDPGERLPDQEPPKPPLDAALLRGESFLDRAQDAFTDALEHATQEQGKAIGTIMHRIVDLGTRVRRILNGEGAANPEPAAPPPAETASYAPRVGLGGVRLDKPTKPALDVRTVGPDGAEYDLDGNLVREVEE